MNIKQIKTVGQIGSWVDFTARVVEVKEQKMRGKADNQRMMTKCKVTDTSGEVIGAWIGGVATIGSVYTLSGMLSEYNNNRYVDWAKIKYTHPSQEVPPDAPQTPQNAPEGTNSQNAGNTTYEDRDKAKNDCICRQCAGKAAAEIVAAFVPVAEGYTISQALNDTLMLSDALGQWFVNGNQLVEEPEDIGF